MDIHSKLNQTFIASDGGLRVAVAHPGEQHARRAAVALQKAGILFRYITSFYYKRTSVVNALPNQLRERLERELGRRRNDEIDDSLVSAIMPIWEIACVAANRCGLPRRVAYRMRRARNQRFGRIVADVIKRQRPDGVIVYDTAALNVLSACRSSGITGILDQSIGHLKSWVSILEKELEQYPQLFDRTNYPLPERRLLEETEQEALTADWILAGSEYTKQTLVALGVRPERIAVVPYGADIELFRPSERVSSEKHRKFRLLFVGSIGLRKGVHYLLEAVRRLRHPEIELLLVGGIEGGGGWLRQYEGLFRWVPFVTHGRLVQLYRDADLFVFPSLHEGFGMVLSEAIASGLPIIGTPHTGAPDILKYGQCGFVVPIRDVEALMSRILQVLEDRELHAEMRATARQVAVEFSWSRYGDRLVAALRRIFGRGGTQSDQASASGCVSGVCR